MIKEYKLPGLYVLGVPEKSLISFVTFSLSFLVLTISYLLYFYFRGCPVELALLPPTESLGDAVEIPFDAAIESIGEKEIIDNTAENAIVIDPGSKPSLLKRIIGFFKKSKVPVDEASTELPEVTPEEQIAEEISDESDGSTPPFTDEVVATEKDVEEEVDDEEKSLKDTIVNLFKSDEDHMEGEQEPKIDIDVNMEQGVPEESSEEESSLKDKIVGLFTKTVDDVEPPMESEQTEDSAISDETMESTDQVQSSIEENSEDAEEANPSLKEKIVGFFKASEPEAVDSDDDILEETDNGEQESGDEQTEMNEEETDEKISLTEKIAGFFQGSDSENSDNIKDDAEPEQLEDIGSIIDDEVLADDADVNVETKDTSNSIKATVQSILGTSTVEVLEEPELNEEQESTEDVSSAETKDIESVLDEDTEIEGSCEDLPEDKTLREKIWNFFGCEDQESEAEPVTNDVESSTEEVETDDVQDQVDNSSEDEDTEKNSIKAAVQNFLGVKEDVKEESENVLETDNSEEIESSADHEVGPDDKSGEQQM